MEDSKLLSLLDEAAQVLKRLAKLNFNEAFDTPEEFAAELKTLRDRLARQDLSALGPLSEIFAPTCVWDDGVVDASGDVADRICKALDAARAGVQT